MRIPIGKANAELLARAFMALGWSQRKMGEVFGVSRRSVIRWLGGGGANSEKGWKTVVGAIHAKDPSVATWFAGQLGETLVSLGIVVPPPLPPPPKPPPPAPGPPVLTPKDVADLVVLAAAEAAGLTPAVVRTVLVAAFEKVAAAKMGMEEVRAALAPATAMPRGRSR
jgi:hypothetical protein